MTAATVKNISLQKLCYIRMGICIFSVFQGNRKKREKSRLIK